MSELTRIKSGIEGLDSMLDGGIPEHNQTIIAGGPGAGKTLLSFEILYRNAKAGIAIAHLNRFSTELSFIVGVLA